MTEKSIREAISAGEYAEAARRFSAFAPTIAVTTDGLRELGELLEWTRAAVLCQRAQSEASLQSLRAQAYAIAAYRR